MGEGECIFPTIDLQTFHRSFKAGLVVAFTLVPGRVFLHGSVPRAI